MNFNKDSVFYKIYSIAALILKKEGRVNPVAFLHTDNGVSLIEIEMPNTQRGKDALAAALRQMVKRQKAKMVVMVMEAWMAVPTPQESAYFHNEGVFPTAPSQHPQRKEIVLFSFQTPDETCSAFAVISRDQKNKPSIPDTPPVLETWPSDGRFGNLFKEDTL